MLMFRLCASARLPKRWASGKLPMTASIGGITVDCAPRRTRNVVDLTFAPSGIPAATSRSCEDAFQSCVTTQRCKHSPHLTGALVALSILVAASGCRAGSAFQSTMCKRASTHSGGRCGVESRGSIASLAFTTLQP